VLACDNCIELLIRQQNGVLPLYTLRDPSGRSPEGQARPTPGAAERFTSPDERPTGEVLIELACRLIIPKPTTLDVISVESTMLVHPCSLVERRFDNQRSRVRARFVESDNDCSVRKAIVEAEFSQPPGHRSVIFVRLTVVFDSIVIVTLINLIRSTPNYREKRIEMV
jgi:hypothetical protein